MPPAPPAAGCSPPRPFPQLGLRPRPRAGRSGCAWAFTVSGCRPRSRRRRSARGPSGAKLGLRARTRGGRFGCAWAFTVSGCRPRSRRRRSARGPSGAKLGLRARTRGGRFGCAWASARRSVRRCRCSRRRHLPRTAPVPRTSRPGPRLTGQLLDHRVAGGTVGAERGDGRLVDPGVQGRSPWLREGAGRGKIRRPAARARDGRWPQSPGPAVLACQRARGVSGTPPRTPAAPPTPRPPAGRRSSLPHSPPSAPPPTGHRPPSAPYRPSAPARPARTSPGWCHA